MSRLVLAGVCMALIAVLAAAAVLHMALTHVPASP